MSANLQVTFSLLVFLRAFLSPFQGSRIDRFGARTIPRHLDRYVRQSIRYRELRLVVYLVRRRLGVRWPARGPAAPTHTGSWIPVFGTAISLDVLTALLALLVLKPMRQRIARSDRASGGQQDMAGEISL